MNHFYFFMRSNECVCVVCCVCGNNGHKSVTIKKLIKSNREAEIDEKQNDNVIIQREKMIGKNA